MFSNLFFAFFHQLSTNPPSIHMTTSRRSQKQPHDNIKYNKILNYMIKPPNYFLTHFMVAQLLTTTTTENDTAWRHRPSNTTETNLSTNKNALRKVIAQL